ncbi:pentapeptide repeat-containing protein [Amycolatopsis coloradensis]|uniref:pentapeptide repeat-containing protein n=1 Tax=Amycolatopsis coloradensis TaxID=76021 RepID=UPI000A04E0F1|nr:pentapeptide repeat-containing protein [Amycolatopsis coloradensis]
MTDSVPGSAPVGKPVVLSVRAIVLSAVVLVAAATGVVWSLLEFAGGGTEVDKSRLDAIRTAGTLVVGAGGAAALLLAALRQRTAGLELAEKTRAASITEHDATERRVTELYTKAAEQLGAGKAPVRLAGLYALERLAQNHPDQRQTIVNVFCAYLRMPYTPTDETPTDDTSAEVVDRHQERIQEREVRLTAQRVLAHHLLRFGTNPDNQVTTFWAEIDLDLAGATLIDLDLSRTTIRHARFGKARFSGTARFDNARFNGIAEFDEARFSGDAVFRRARFNGTTRFGGVRFNSNARFGGAQFRRGMPQETRPYLRSDHDGTAPHGAPDDPDSAN